jgi:DNA-binding NarL/FixJ family response regulator
MRVLIVGPPDVRARLRAALPAAVIVAGEFATEAEARQAGAAADAVLSDASGRAVGDSKTPVERSPTAAVDGGLDGARRLPLRGLDLVEHLTPRELQVLGLLAEGLANRAIAERLHISDQTVKFHIASIMGKLGTTNRVQTVRRAVRRGLIAL